MKKTLGSMKFNARHEHTSLFECLAEGRTQTLLESF